MLQILTKLFPQLYKTRDQILDEARAQAQEIISRAKQEAITWREKEEMRLNSLTKQALDIEKKVLQEESECKEKKIHIAKVQ